MATCKFCGGSITWTLTPGGRRLAVDAIPDRESGAIVVRAGYAHRLAGAALTQARDQDTPLYTAHDGTCPRTRRWRPW